MMGRDMTLLNATLGQEGLVRKAALVIGGSLLIALALPRGRIANSYAGWDRFVYWPM